MNKNAYGHLKKYLDEAIKFCPTSDALRIHQGVIDHMDALVSDTSTSASIGHLFVSRFSQESIPLNQPCSLGMQALGHAAFKWAMQEEDWTCAAWLITFSGLCIPLPSPVHPHPHVLNALACNDTHDWPQVYKASLSNENLVVQAMACDKPGIIDDEDALCEKTRKYSNQIRKSCYLGPGRGIFAVNTVISWLALHNDSDSIPEKMVLTHAHPEEPDLSRMLQNQWRVEQFWLTGDATHLDGLVGIEDNDFQAWFWFLSAIAYNRYGNLSAKLPIWDAWWAAHLPNVVSQASFWLNLYVQMQGLNPSSLNKNERLLAVKAALALASCPPDGLYELPVGYQEIPQVEVLFLPSRWAQTL